MDTREDKVQHLIEAIFAVHEHEPIDCETCSEQFDCLVEMVMRGTDLRELVPAVEAHLRCCRDCREEFDALLSILKAEASGETEFPADH